MKRLTLMLAIAILAYFTIFSYAEEKKAPEEKKPAEVKKNPETNKEEVKKAEPKKEAPDADKGKEGSAKAAAPKEAKEKAKDDIDMKKVSYALGYNISMSLKEHNLKIDLESLSKAVNEVDGGKEPSMNEEEVMQVMQDFQRSMMMRAEEKRKKDGEENVKKSADFLAKNKKEKGVKTLESGLQYKVIKEGKGKTPKDTDMVKVHYRGTFLDGKEFDSSYKRNEPAEFPVTGVIPGWTEALKLMKEGSKWQLYVPPDLAYGEQGNRGIPPNSLLLFEVELLEVLPEKKEAPIPDAPAAPKGKK